MMDIKPIVVTDKNALVELFNVKCLENCYMCEHRNLETGFCRLVNEAPEIEVVPKDFFERFADLQAKEIVRLSLELSAAVKCAQRFSFFNERKCRWCRFGFLDEEKEWDCAHPLKDAPCKGNPFAYPCRRFEYVYREENAK